LGDPPRPGDQREGLERGVEQLARQPDATRERPLRTEFAAQPAKQRRPIQVQADALALRTSETQAPTASKIIGNVMQVPDQGGFLGSNARNDAMETFCDGADASVAAHADTDLPRSSAGAS
jgi:hypothetical protein